MSEFEFKDENRELPLHTFDGDGKYIGIISTPIPANQGPPGRTIYGDIVTENNPVWNSSFHRIEYSDVAGAKWFINDAGENIALDTKAVKAEKPNSESGHIVLWIDGGYQQIEDHRGETWYSTTNGNSLEIEELGQIPNGYTDSPRTDEYHVFEGGEWIYKKEIEKPFKIILMRQLRDEKLTLVINSIDKHRIDQEVDEEYKSSKSIDDNQLLELYALRKVLQDFPECDNFPFCDFPEIPTWLN